MPSHFAMRRRFVLTLLCLFAGGCADSPPDHIMISVHPPRAVSVRATQPAGLNPIAEVQGLLLYRNAETACRRHDYFRAVHLLQRLAVTPQLSTAQRHFVWQQRDICLKDAAHFAPALAASTPASSAAVSRPHTPEEADCGPRALLLVSKQLGIHTGLPALRKLAGTTGQGTTLAGLAQAARAVGLKAEGVQVSREALPQIQMPALAFVNGNHFAAVLALQGEGEMATATVHDPNQRQEETISQERLLRLSSGYLLLVHR